MGLLRSPIIQEFCRAFNKRTLAEVHTSLVNRDRISLILQKHRSIHYPLGSSRLAAAYEWQLRHRGQADRVSNSESIPNQFWIISLIILKYIQHFFDDGQNFVIICFSQQQASLFSNQSFKSFELDMNYKHLGEADEREVIWGFYSHQTQRGTDA